MDYDQLVDILATRVAASLAAAKQPQETAMTCCIKNPDGSCALENDPTKPILLLLTQEHDAGPMADPRTTNLDKHKLREVYRLQCALQNKYEVDLAAVDTIILYGLSNQDLGKIANGIADTPYTRLATQAILMGKKIFILHSQIELFRYKGIAPMAYYQMMTEKLALLEKSGMTICDDGKLEDSILQSTVKTGNYTKKAEPAIEQQSSENGATLQLDKRVITEQDLSRMAMTGVAQLRIGAGAIVTDLAKDFLAARNIIIVRQ